MCRNGIAPLGGVAVRQGYARFRVVMVEHGPDLFCLGRVAKSNVSVEWRKVRWSLAME